MSMHLGYIGDLNCPGDPGCPGYVDPNAAAIQAQLDLAASGACTCVAGTCKENGNSCTSSYVPQGPLQPPAASQWIKGVDNKTVLVIAGITGGLILLGRAR